jgi:hypothetical protein
MNTNKKNKHPLYFYSASLVRTMYPVSYYALAKAKIAMELTSKFNKKILGEVINVKIDYYSSSLDTL